MNAPAEAVLTRGHGKKARTRRQLLDAGLRVLEAKGTDLTPRDVTAEAGMSSGTFYNYFPGTDELIDEIMRDQLHQIAEAPAEQAIDDPALRIAVTATTILHRALADAVWGQLVLRLVQRALEPNRMNVHLRDDLVEGHEAGRFARGADEATLDQAMGLLVMTIRRFVVSDARPELVSAMVARLLETLGLSDAEAAHLASAAATIHD